MSDSQGQAFLVSTLRSAQAEEWELFLIGARGPLRLVNWGVSRGQIWQREYW